MADNSEKKSEIFEVGNKRGNLELTKIDERDTIEEFVKKVNDNFMNLAAHGGGPSGKDGKDGKDGVDGKDGKRMIFHISQQKEMKGINYLMMLKTAVFHERHI